MPPDRVNSPVPVEIRVRFVALRVKGDTMVNGEMPAWLTLTTLVPIVAVAAIVAVPVPVPALVIVPTVLMAAPERVMPPVLLALRVRFPVPVTPPEIVSRVPELLVQLWEPPMMTLPGWYLRQLRPGS